VGAAILVAAGLIVANTHVSMVYFVVAPVFAVLPAAIFPIFLGALSRIDLSGRLVAANQAFLMLGGALAPLIGGALSDYAGYPANGVAVACFVGIGVVLAIPALARADALRS
jgi:fucose permease